MTQDVVVARPKRYMKQLDMSSSERVQAHRERMRAKGYRPVQIWVPDVTSPEFAKEAARQSRIMAQSEDDTIDFLEAVSASWDADE